MYGFLPLSRDNMLVKNFNNMVDSIFGKEELFDSFKLDVKEEETGYVIEAEVPGFNKEDIALDYENGFITITATRKEEKEEKKYLHRERSVASVRRSLKLDDTDGEGITAKYADGILTVSVPKKAAAKKTVISID